MRVGPVAAGYMIFWVDVLERLKVALGEFRNGWTICPANEETLNIATVAALRVRSCASAGGSWRHVM